MITFHEIRRIIQKMAILSSHITQLNELLPQVVLLSEKIDNINSDLTLERDRFTAKIRSVEVIGEILKTHVYQNQTVIDPDSTKNGTGTVARAALDDQSSAYDSITDSNGPDTVTGENQGGIYRHLDGRSMTR